MTKTKAEKILEQKEEEKKKALAKQVIDNIMYFAEAKGVSRADLEKAVDMSPGYLSRLSKEDNTTIPNVEKLLLISKELGVTIDSLIKPRIADDVENASILLGFLEKVTNDTVEGAIEWEAETVVDLMTKDQIDSEGNPEHPLFRRTMAPQPWPTDYPEYVGKYFSFFGDQCEASFMDDCYHAKLPFTGAEVYLMNIETYEMIRLDDGTMHDQEVECFELCLYKDGVEPLCRTDLVSPEVDNAVRSLYYTIKRELNSNKLSKQAKSIINDYMTDVPF